MKALAVLAVTAALGSAAPCTTLRLPRATTAGETMFYGHVKSLTRVGSHFELRFDPAWWLTGVTASRAQREDTGSGEVANDYYIVDESHRVLTFVVPASARVTVLTRGPCSTQITASELAQIVARRRPRPGFWIRVAGDTVRSLDQQYQP